MESAQSPRRGPPSLALLLLEAPRAVAAASLLLPALPVLRRAPRGDGHPVLVLPGFSASDVSTRVLRRYITSLGYEAHPWTLGRNFGLADGLLEKLMDRL